MLSYDLMNTCDLPAYKDLVLYMASLSVVLTRVCVYFLVSALNQTCSAASK